MKLRYLYRAYRARYRDQRHEISAARAALRPGATAADIGAHKGAYLYWLKHAVGKAGKVHAFEPQSSLAAYLQAITHTMNWQNVFVHECALADRAGTSRLHVPGDGDSPSASLGDHVGQNGPNHSYECVVDTLDSKLQGSKQVGFLKVDVEGFELQVFRGAEQILEQHAPVILFECETRHLVEHTMADVFAFLMDRGYTGSFFAPDGLRPVEEFDAEVHQRHTPGRFWDAVDYCNNFLFKPRTQIQSPDS